jgi:hypothetical protein
MCWDSGRGNCYNDVRARDTKTNTKDYLPPQRLITLDYVGTSHLSVSGKSPTMPRALCDLLAAELALHPHPRAFGLRDPAECRAASAREPDAGLLPLFL